MFVGLFTKCVSLKSAARGKPQASSPCFVGDSLVVVVVGGGGVNFTFTTQPPMNASLWSVCFYFGFPLRTSFYMCTIPSFLSFSVPPLPTSSHPFPPPSLPPSQEAAHGGGLPPGHPDLRPAYPKTPHHKKTVLCPHALVGYLIGKKGVMIKRIKVCMYVYMYIYMYEYSTYGTHERGTATQLRSVEWGGGCCRFLLGVLVSHIYIDILHTKYLEV